MPLDFQDKIKLIQDEKEMFGSYSGEDENNNNYNSPFGKIGKRINSQNSNKE